MLCRKRLCGIAECRDLLPATARWKKTSSSDHHCIFTSPEDKVWKIYNLNVMSVAAALFINQSMPLHRALSASSYGSKTCNQLDKNSSEMHPLCFYVIYIYWKNTQHAIHNMLWSTERTILECYNHSHYSNRLKCFLHSRVNFTVKTEWIRSLLPHFLHKQSTIVKQPLALPAHVHEMSVLQRRWLLQRSVNTCTCYTATFQLTFNNEKELAVFSEIEQQTSVEQKAFPAASIGAFAAAIITLFQAPQHPMARIDLLGFPSAQSSSGPAHLRLVQSFSPPTVLIQI